MGAIDRNRVKLSFGRQAHEYDSHADVQKSVIMRFPEILLPEETRPERILDMGTGTGMLLGRLSGIFPGATLFGIDLALEMTRVARRNMPDGRKAEFQAADAELLPFAEGAFDLVVSASAFQWLDSLGPAFAEAFRVLEQGGTFCFALFGESTLCELKNSYRRALASSSRPAEDRTHTFHTAREVEESLSGAGFVDCRVTSEKYLEYHENVAALLRCLKNVGAGSAARVPLRGLAGRRVLQGMMDSYARMYRRDGRIPATYEVIYARGRKSRSLIQNIDNVKGRTYKIAMGSRNSAEQF